MTHVDFAPGSEERHWDRFQAYRSSERAIGRLSHSAGAPDRPIEPRRVNP
jgi:hypothetical protein